MVLKGLQTLEELNGLKYSELPTGVDTNLGMRPLRTVTLLNQTAKGAKYQVFQRLNTGGEALEPQEIRNSAFRGPFNDLLIQLSENPFLKAQMKIKDQKSVKSWVVVYLFSNLGLVSWRWFRGHLGDKG